jgi:hypothetical protein
MTATSSDHRNETRRVRNRSRDTSEIDFLFECAFETQKENRVKFDEEVLHLLGRAVVQFNSLESDWKHALAVLIRDGQDPRRQHEKLLECGVSNPCSTRPAN